MAETVEEIQQMLEKVAIALESRGLRINREKTEYMCCTWGREEEVGEVVLQSYAVKMLQSSSIWAQLLEAMGN